MRADAVIVLIACLPLIVLFWIVGIVNGEAWPRDKRTEAQKELNRKWRARRNDRRAIAVIVLALVVWAMVGIGNAQHHSQVCREANAKELQDTIVGGELWQITQHSPTDTYAVQELARYGWEADPLPANSVIGQDIAAVSKLNC